MNTMVNRAFRFCSISLLLGSLTSVAFADEPPPVETLDFRCDGTYRTAVEVDGYQVDWEAEASPADRVQSLISGEFEFDWTGPNDASFRLWCRASGDHLYFAIVGRDADLINEGIDERSDYVEFFLQPDGQDQIIHVQVPVGDLEAGSLTPVWGPESGRRGPVEGARAEVSERPRGYFLELAIPFAAHPALRAPFGPEPFAVVYRDWDGDASRERQAAVASADVEPDEPGSWGTIRYTEPMTIAGAAALDLRAAPPSPDDLTLGDVGGDPAAEAVFVIDGRLFVAGPALGSFGWASTVVLPSDRYEPMSTELRDLDGDDDHEILFRYRRSRRSIDAGGDVVQEFLVAIDLLPDLALATLFTQEVARTLPDGTRFALELADEGVRFERTGAADGNWVELRVDDGVRAIPAPGAADVIVYEPGAAGRWQVRDDS